MVAITLSIYNETHVTDAPRLSFGYGMPFVISKPYVYSSIISNCFVVCIIVLLGGVITKFYFTSRRCNSLWHSWASVLSQYIIRSKKIKNEQLERLRSAKKNTPPQAYIYYEIIWNPKSKKDKVKARNLKIYPKFCNFEKKILTHLLKMLDRMYEIWHGSIQYLSRYRADMIPSTDGQTDGRAGG